MADTAGKQIAKRRVPEPQGCAGELRYELLGGGIGSALTAWLCDWSRPSMVERQLSWEFTSDLRTNLGHPYATTHQASRHKCAGTPNAYVMSAAWSGKVRAAARERPGKELAFSVGLCHISIPWGQKRRVAQSGFLPEAQTVSLRDRSKQSLELG